MPLFVSGVLVPVVKRGKPNASTSYDPILLTRSKDHQNGDAKVRLTRAAVTIDGQARGGVVPMRPP
jgi:hypothetical protein